MPNAQKAHAPPAQPSPAVRLVNGAVFRVAHRPDGIVSPATAALQAIAKTRRSQQPQAWAVFPVAGRDLVVAGYLSSRTPVSRDYDFAIEPGAPLARAHSVVSYLRSEGMAIGGSRGDAVDADRVSDFVDALAGTDAWKALGAARVDLRTLPGAEAHDELWDDAFVMLSDDGSAADVVYGMSFWRAGDTYSSGRVATWTRPVGESDTVRVVGVRACGVDASTPLVIAPPPHGPAADAEREAIVRETRAVLDSERPFGWYFISAGGPPAP